MITNRNIESATLFERALEEIVESAQASGVSDTVLAEILQSHAAQLDTTESG